MQTRLLLTGLSATLLFAACGAGGQDGDTPPPGGAKAVTEDPTGLGIPEGARSVMLAQIPLQQAASRIRNAVEGGDDAGYAGIELAQGRVVLWWKGALSPSMAVVVSEANRIAPVEVRPAVHSRAELRAASDSLLPMMRLEAASGVHAVLMPADGHGLIVNTDGDPQATALGMPAVAVPYTVAQAPRLRLQSRTSDSPAWWGGAMIVNDDNGAWCTSGFGVSKGSTHYLLTAGHCGRPGGGWWNGDVSWFIGKATLENVGHDLLLIESSAGNRVYDGVAGSNVSKGVAGWDWVHSGESLCVSGVSGVICGLTVTNNFTFAMCGTDPYGHNECYSDLIVARPGIRLTADGDSGGPYFSLASNGRVTAKGTHTGLSGGLEVFQDFGTATRDFGITVLTSPN
jgi:streptogrisin D